ncbi:transcriptional regulator, MarR family [Paracoccus halophilus]|uniref:Transcriptional regulator, MarR family n=1 Tax=Paracoccus halophilus TaxID=376733 RepID=A0A099F4J8_9RHOB|nr:MarR family transcriptional regulator [Paracoccus halophilus]KGJ05354.1 hypothetical protein IT41_06155 [Paracoccus halophilus]SFA48829.1 transcriptional regulator, MarR family [Paracoccus halophilus]
MNHRDRIRLLINRHARLDAALMRSAQLNAVQVVALEYLANANRFSRSPSHVADYLGTTRGTMSQTLKSLEAKGLVSEERLADDRRSIRYRLTEAGRAALRAANADRCADTGMNDADQAMLERLLARSLADRVARTGTKMFGICRECRHHELRQNGQRYCHLLNVVLAEEEAEQLCHEQVPA